MQPAGHSPSTVGGSPLGQVKQSVELPPSHVVHDGSQGEQPVSLVAVHTALSNCPGGQVGVQFSHAVLPVVSAKVPEAQLRQDEVPWFGWYVPTAQSGQLVEPTAG